ncbi:AAA family ATPase [Halobacteriovorax sp. YZS-1-1]|uniref:AAA family ATPase n=1 Tax=unclassified Halobacteriovorax TaxID=2639665 RepID=UPI00399A67D5
MKRIKIIKIQIFNFKVFRNEEIEFKDSDVLILDGPNGYGKTSFFDAVELLLTGEINRLVRKKSDVDLRKRFEDNLLVNDLELDETFIKAELVIDGKRLFLCRYAKWGHGEKNNPTDFTNFNLYKLNKFDDGVEEADFFSEDEVELALGQGFRESYPVMHYVEQDESAFLLKRKEGDRTEFLSYLFHTVKEEKEYSSICKKLDYLRSLEKELSEDINAKKKELTDLKTGLIEKNIKEVSYKEIFPEVFCDWDEEEITFGYQKWESIHKPEVKNLIFMKDYFADFKQARINTFLERYKANDTLLKYHVSSSFFQDRLKDFKDNEKIKKYLERMSSKLMKFTGLSSLDDVDFEKLFNYVDLTKKFTEEFYGQLDDLGERTKEIGIEEQYFASLQNDRSKLEKHLTSSHVKDSSECLLCGFQYEDAESLKKNIDNLTVQIKKNITKKVGRIQKDIEKFGNTLIVKLVEKVKKKITSLEEDMPTSYYNLLVYEQKTSDEYKTFMKGLNSLKLDISDLVNSDLALSEKEINEKVENLKDLLEKQVKDVEDEFYDQVYRDLLREYFNGKLAALEKFNKSLLVKKIEYVENEIAKKQSDKILKLEKLITKKNEQKKLFGPMITNIKKLTRIYEKRINKYKSRVISAIEIPFYIYSGRIIQTFNRGSGFFIDIDMDKELRGVKFKTDLKTSHDALFSLSSGQLSILVISFMLALNRVYAQNNLMLIDDPVQSMDEVNISSLVELLRSDFSNYHLILSTHEEHISLYMDYKFESSDAISNCLNMKNLRFK